MATAATLKSKKQTPAQDSSSRPQSNAHKRHRLRFPLLIKFSGITIFFIAILMGLVTWFVYEQERQAFERELVLRGKTIATNLASNASEYMLTHDDLSLAVLVKGSVQAEEIPAVENPTFIDRLQQIPKDLSFRSEATQKNEGVVEAIVVDNSGTIVAHSGHSETNPKIGTKYLPPSYLEMASETIPYPTYEFRGHKCFDIAVDITQKQTLQPFGKVHLGIRRDIIDQPVRVAATKIIAITVLMVAIGILITFLLVHYLTRPVGRLMEGVQAIAQGDFTKQITLKTRDELGDLIEAYNGMTVELSKNENLKSAFSRFTSSSLMKNILADPSQMAKLGGKRTRVTVYFSLVHDLGEISETMDPAELVKIINEYLSAQTEAIAAHGGTVDKFVREEVMAVWGLGDTHEDDPLHAVEGALESLKKVAELNRKREQRGERTFEVSIGINTGEAVTGNIGSQQKLDYTCIGDAVNTAARLGLRVAKGGEVLISESTFKLTKNHLNLEELEPVKVKGKKEPLKVFRVKSLKRK